jgi:hypothetical protein
MVLFLVLSRSSLADMHWPASQIKDWVLKSNTIAIRTEYDAKCNLLAMTVFVFLDTGRKRRVIHGSLVVQMRDGDDLPKGR